MCWSIHSAAAVHFQSSGDDRCQYRAGHDAGVTADCWGKVVPKKVWYNAYDEAEDMIRRDVQMNIQGYDLDPEIVKCAKANAKAAGVGDISISGA